MTFLVLYILLILILLHILIRYRKMGRLVNKIPGPVPIPFLGNMLKFVGSRDTIWNFTREMAAQYSIARIWFFMNAWVAVYDPDDVQILLTQKINIDKNAVYEYMIPFVGTCLLTSGGEKWRNRRKLMNPGFHLNIMSTYMEISCVHIEKFITQIKLCGNESVQELMPPFLNLMLKIICDSTMGVNLDKLDTNDVKEYSHALHEAYACIIYRSARPFIRDWMLKILPMGRLQHRAQKSLRNFSNKIIQERRKYINLMKDYSYQDFIDDDSFEDKNKKVCLLDLLLLAENDGLIDAEGVIEEVEIFLIAGHDTTATSLVFQLMLLAENREIQNRARAEADKVFNECNGKLTIPKIQNLEYIDRCIKEGLRMFPSVAHFIRYIRKDLQLKEYILPAGINALVAPFDIHRNPTLWPEPNKYDPDRFLPENVKNRHPFAYIPFSAGPRNCIGRKFAVLALKSIVAHILHNFYLEPVDNIADIKFRASIVLEPSHPVHVKFVSRNLN